MAAELDVLVLAAGRGTRMGGDLPKVLHAILGEPMIVHVLEAAKVLGARETGVIVGHGRERVKARLAGRDLAFVVQKEQLGTGHAVRQASRRFAGRDGDVVVLSGDVPLITPETLAALVAGHRRARAAATVLTAELEVPGSLGRILRDGRGRITAIVEARDADPEQLAIREINSGIYVFRSADLFAGLKALKRQAGSGEYYLTDVVRDLVAAGKTVRAVRADDPVEALGVNTPDELLEAQDRLRRRIARHHAARGVAIVDPANTFIAPGVRIGPETVIWPFSVIRADVSIGARCRVGPFAHLREGTVLDDGAAVGSFVETKAARFGPGAAAHHLAYVGDASVGAGANVGAGAVTANYDGVAKHRTEIGEGAFVGSGAILVAPVRIGEDAVVGAGAVVTAGRDVAPGSVVAGVPARRLEGSRASGRGKKGAKARRRPSRGA